MNVINSPIFFFFFFAVVYHKTTKLYIFFENCIITVIVFGIAEQYFDKIAFLSLLCNCVVVFKDLFRHI